MGTGLEIALLVGSAATGIYSANQQSKAAKAQANAMQAAKPKPPPQEAKKPAHEVLFNANAAAGLGAGAGNSSTFLTGPKGIDPSSLNLGKNQLLGQ